jgi:hypothetical protein
MAEGCWTPLMIEERLVEAANVMRRLPPVKVQGYYSLWPRYRYEFADLVGQDPPKTRLPPPSPDAITRMDETMEWLRWLEPEDAKLVWARAERTPWKGICVQLGMSRATAHRHWQYALVLIAWRLNGKRVLLKQSRSALLARVRAASA